MSNELGQIQFDADVLQYVLLSRKIDDSILDDHLIKSYDYFGSLLHYAAFNCNTAVVRQLIALGSEVDSLGLLGQTPFMHAVEGLGCTATLAKIFLKAKASIDVVDDVGKSVLQRVLASYVSYDYYSPLVKLIASKVQTKRTTPEALAKRLIAAGCKLYEAAAFRDFKVMQCMLEHGVDVNSKSTILNRTALHRAAEMDGVDIANWLINNGADVNARDRDAATAVHLAASWRCKKVLKILLERGADPNYKDSDCEYSPLAAVCVRRDEVGDFEDGYECVKLLLQHGAIIENSLHEDSLVLDYALDTCGDETVRMLIGQLVMLEMLGTSNTKEEVFCKDARHRSKLPELKDFRQLCLQILTTKIVQDLSLLDLLNISEARLNSLVRRKTFAPNLKRACSKHKLSETHAFYYDTLMKRIDKADRIVKLEDKAILAMCRLFRCTYNQCHNFAREIVNCLNECELEVLIQV